MAGAARGCGARARQRWGVRPCARLGRAGPGAGGAAVIEVQGEGGIGGAGGVGVSSWAAVGRVGEKQVLIGSGLGEAMLRIAVRVLRFWTHQGFEMV